MYTGIKVDPKSGGILTCSAIETASYLNIRSQCVPAVSHCSIDYSLSFSVTCTL